MQRHPRTGLAAWEGGGNLPVMLHVRYLHGFASSPRTQKGLDLGRRLAGRVASYGIPDLEGGDFRALTMTGIFARAEAALRDLPEDGQGCLLIGSSLGGYSAAWLAAARRAPRVRGLLLIAPALGFASSWRDRLGEAGLARWRAQGELPFRHHAHEREEPLGVAFLDSCLGLPDLPDDPGLPTVVVQGRQDATVDHRLALAWAGRHPGIELHLVEGDHRLTDPRHEELIAWCAGDLLARCG